MFILPKQKTCFWKLEVVANFKLTRDLDQIGTRVGTGTLYGSDFLQVELKNSLL